VVLRYYLDCSTIEAAATLGISEGSVKQHLHRALGALGRVLEKEEDA
jgi:DNA-directed RNA polymerase specialized sigma24 family protein